MPKGRLYIVSAPSGGGKTSLVRMLASRMDKLVISVSHTTRKPRPGEVNDLNYHFVTEEKFKAFIADNLFLEHALVFGHYYGTSRDWVMQHLMMGFDVILEIDWQGARQIKQQLPESVGIFILPPSLEVLQKRLRERGQDSETVIEKRMQQAQTEMSHCAEFDYLVINDSFDLAVSQLETILLAGRLSCTRQLQMQRQLIETLTHS